MQRRLWPQCCRLADPDEETKSRLLRLWLPGHHWYQTADMVIEQGQDHYNLFIPPKDGRPHVGWT